MSELACLDGVVAPAADTRIPVTDEGLLRGDGAFEVVRVYGGIPLALDEHLDRMERSAANLRLEGPFHRDRYQRESGELLAARDGSGFDGLLRLLLTRGGRRLLITEQLPAGPAVARLASVTYAPPRVLDGVKSLSYAANMLCSRIARERGCDEALLVTPHRRVLEGPTSSFFWVDADGSLCTPPLDDHVLASITRRHLLDLLDVSERGLALEDVTHAREAFLASTTREVQPVAAVDDVELVAPGEVTRAAATAFAARRDELLQAA